MKYVYIKGKKEGKDIEIKVSAILMGSGDFLTVENKDAAFPILDKFLELGGTTFDTARHYRHSEQAIAAWMREKGTREQVTILTKCCHPTREARDVSRVTSEAIIHDLQVSLETLGTDHVELLALHRDDPAQPVGPLMHTLDQLVKEGKVYAIGTSNWEIDRIVQANEYAKTHGLTEFTFNSPHLSLAKPLKPVWPDSTAADEKAVAWHREVDMPLIAWSAQAGGFFTGRFSPDYLEDQNMVDVFYSDENWERYERAQQLAVKKGVSLIQIALAYVVNQPFKTAAVVGPNTMAELLSSYEGSLITLNEDEINWLDLKIN